MNVEATLEAVPFDASVLDEATELRALQHALELATGFALFFVRCNQPAQRQHLIAALQERLPQLSIQQIDFKEPVHHLLDALRERVANPLPGAVFVSGLEYSLPTSATAHATSFVANLNAARNSFPQIVPCPTVLWVPEYVLTAIAQGAPDFFSIRSGIYFFASTPSDKADLVESLTAGEVWMAASLTAREKIERIKDIHRLISDYTSLPSLQRSLRTELVLLARLGHLYRSLGRWAEAKEAFQQALAIANSGGDHHSAGVFLTNLGNIYTDQGVLAEAEKIYKQALSTSRRIGDQRNEATILNNLGSLYSEQDEWARAEESYQQALCAATKVSDHAVESLALNNLGVIYMEQGKWPEAIGSFQKALNLAQEIGDRYGQGITLNNLGNVYRNQNDWAQAESTYQQGLLISSEIGDRQNAARILVNLARLALSQGKLVQALDFAEESMTVAATTEDESLKAQTQVLINRLSQMIVQQQAA